MTAAKGDSGPSDFDLGRMAEAVDGLKAQVVTLQTQIQNCTNAFQEGMDDVAEAFDSIRRERPHPPCTDVLEVAKKVRDMQTAKTANWKQLSLLGSLVLGGVTLLSSMVAIAGSRVFLNNKVGAGQHMTSVASPPPHTVAGHDKE